MKDAVRAALDDQIRHEFQSAYFYLSASGYCESVNLSGLAHWMREQSREEVRHAMKIFSFVHDRGDRAVLQALDQPPVDFTSPLDAFSQALAHERAVTASIHRLYALSVQEADYPAQILLQWFVSEQVEEEKTAGGIVEALTMAGDNSVALLLLDQQLGARKGEEE